MPKPNSLRPFIPDPAQMERVPAVSGNAINGMGETEFRRPEMVYWAPNTDDIAHGEMQKWFFTVNPNEPEIVSQRAVRQKILDKPLSDVSKTVVEKAPSDWTSALAQFVTSGSCEKVGVGKMDVDWSYEGQKVTQANVIVLGVQHDYEPMTHAPYPIAAGEVMRQYTRAAGVAKEVASWLREQGWDAEPVTGPMTGSIALIPAALAAGFGELGKHGSIINPEFGSSFRLSAVLTDAPFEATHPQEHGIDDFCQSCRICEDACPPEALSPDKKLVRGETKWYVDFDRCLPFFNQHHGCAICIAVCPWSRPGVGLNLAAKLARRAERLSET